MNQQENYWIGAITIGLSLINFCEQNVDLVQLKIMVDGWVHWAISNCPKGVDADKGITHVINTYSRQCETQGGQVLESQKNIVEVFRELSN